MLGPIEAEPTGAEGEETGEGDSGPGGFGSGFVGLIDTQALAGEALIEEPVASGGDSTLWTDCEDEDPDGDDQC